MIKTILAHITTVLLGACLVIIFFQTCGKPAGDAGRIDTLSRVIEHHWHEKETQTIVQPTLVQTHLPAPADIPAPYQADTNCNKLRDQYSGLLNEHFAINSFTDTVRFDSLGYLVLSQDVYRNLLRPYVVKAKHRYPEIRETITLQAPAKKRFQLYAGLEVTGNQQGVINGGSIGFLAKSRKDQIYKVAAGVMRPVPGVPAREYFTIGTYWKIGKR